MQRDWPFLIIVLALFILGIWLGVLLPRFNPTMAHQLMEVAKKRFAEIAGALKNSPAILEIWVIWLNNLVASLTAIIAGLFLGPLFPALFVFGNGVVIGLFQPLISTRLGIEPYQFYLSLLPHGIFELPAFFLAAWVGMRFGIISWTFIWDFLRGRSELGFFKGLYSQVAAYFKSTARNYAILITAMLLVAAVLEVIVSPLLFRH